MVRFIIGIAIVAGLGSAYIFAFRQNNKGKSGCVGCAVKKCSGCELNKKAQG